MLPLALPQGPALPFIPSSPQHLPLPSLHVSQAMASPQAGTAGTSSAPNRSLGGSEPMSSLVTQEQGAVMQGHERVPWKACSRRFLAQLQGWGGSATQRPLSMRGSAEGSPQSLTSGLPRALSRLGRVELGACRPVSASSEPRVLPGWPRALGAQGGHRTPSCASQALTVLGRPLPPFCVHPCAIRPLWWRPSQLRSPVGPAPVSLGHRGACEPTSASVCAAVTYT